MAEIFSINLPMNKRHAFSLMTLDKNAMPSRPCEGKST